MTREEYKNKIEERLIELFHETEPGQIIELSELSLHIIYVRSKKMMFVVIGLVVVLVVALPVCLIGIALADKKYFEVMGA